jgi:hypothetical protein
MSRERLLVANDAALRGHLTEFKDHDLLQTRWPAHTPTHILHPPHNPGEFTSEMTRILIEREELCRALYTPSVGNPVVGSTKYLWCLTGIFLLSPTRGSMQRTLRMKVLIQMVLLMVVLCMHARRGQDGSDLLVIPIEAQTLLQVLEDVDAPTWCKPRWEKEKCRHKEMASAKEMRERAAMHLNIVQEPFVDVLTDNELIHRISSLLQRDRSWTWYVDRSKNKSFMKLTACAFATTEI